MARSWRNRIKKRAPQSFSSLEAERVSLEAAKKKCESFLKNALSKRQHHAEMCIQLKALRERLLNQGDTIRIFGVNFGHTKAVKSQIKSIDDYIGGVKNVYAVDDRKWANLEVAIYNLEQEMTSTIQRLDFVMQQQNKIKLKARRTAERAELAAKREQIRQDRLDANAHLAARARGNIRAESSRLRTKLRRDHPCPYCGGNLGLNMHADHIHPVSKGGLSIESNYVMVCQPCNQAKRDMTLNQFIEHMGYNRETILRTLKLLGKDA